MRTSLLWQLPAVTLGLLMVVGCDGEDSNNCRIIETDEASSTIRCPDGSQAVISHGEDGAPGRTGADGGPHPDSCALTDHDDGTATLKCGDKELLIHRDCPDGFPGDLVLGEGFSGDNDAELTAIAFQLAGCTEVQGAVIIDGYFGATLPSHLAGIERVGGDLIIGMEMGNEHLESASFPLIRTIGGMLMVAANPSLTHLGDFSALQEVQSIDITDNYHLEELGSFPSLEETMSVYIDANRVLANVDGLFNIARITDYVNISTNCSLDDTTARVWALESLVPDPDDYNLHVDNNAGSSACL